MDNTQLTALGGGVTTVVVAILGWLGGRRQITYQFKQAVLTNDQSRDARLDKVTADIIADLRKTEALLIERLDKQDAEIVGVQRENLDLARQLLVAQGTLQRTEIALANEQAARQRLERELEGERNRNSELKSRILSLEQAVGRQQGGDD